MTSRGSAGRVVQRVSRLVISAAGELARQGGEQAIEAELREVLTAAGLAGDGPPS